MRERVKVALALGLLFGGLEAVVRSDPRYGLLLGDRLVFLAMALGANLLVALPALWRPGLGLAALLALHAGLAWRFEVVLNEFARDPKVWGGLSLIAIASLGVGLALGARLRATPLAALGALAALGSLLRGVPGEAGEGSGPNILLITLDTTRWDRLGAYGGPARTPNLDRLAAEGARFSQAIAAAPLTEPSHLSLMSGQRTTTHGVVSNGTPIGDRPEVLARRLQAAGWRTGAVVSGFPLHSKYGWAQGFDAYDDDFGRVPGMHRLSLGRAFEQLFVPGNTLRERPGDLALARAEAFLDASGEGPWFLWLHLFDPHGPYEASDLASAPRDGEPLALPPYWPPPHRAITSVDWLVRAYDEEIERVDALLGPLLERVGPDTVVVVTADHGESLTEHGYLFDHGDLLTDPSLRVPWLVRAPGVDAGRTLDCQVSGIDLAPTLAELVGLPALPVDGRSLAGALRGMPCSDVPALSTTVGARFVAEPPVDASLRTSASKLIRKDALGEGGEQQLFDLVADPGELRPLSDAVLEAAAGAEMDRALGRREAQAPSMDEASREALRALGYVE